MGQIKTLTIFLTAASIFFNCGGYKKAEVGKTEQGGAYVEGYVINLNCWLGQGIRGPEHKDCARVCANMGTPLAILADDGRIYFPVLKTMSTCPEKNNAKLLPFVEERVLVEGEVINREEEYAIVISNIKRTAEPAVRPEFKSEEIPNSEITGQVVDLNRWLGQGLRGEAHCACPEACANMNRPLVLLIDGYIYYPVVKRMPAGPESNMLLLEYAGQPVTVKGTIIQRGAQRAIVIESVSRGEIKN